MDASAFNRDKSHASHQRPGSIRHLFASHRGRRDVFRPPVQAWEDTAMTTQLKLVSHKLCPYVQRAVIALTEKGVPFERVDIDLDNKPDWFLKISPLGKTPVLVVGDTAIFESAVIVEYLEESQPNPLHPNDPLQRAEHRAWIEFNSAILGDIWGLEVAADEATLAAKATQLESRLALLERRLVGTWF